MSSILIWFCAIFTKTKIGGLCFYFVSWVNCVLLQRWSVLLHSRFYGSKSEKLEKKRPKKGDGDAEGYPKNTAKDTPHTLAFASKRCIWFLKLFLNDNLQILKYKLITFL